jgi:4-amino-4-deoxy-L-arabinose transferase-like glycosyltransferase
MHGRRGYVRQLAVPVVTALALRLTTALLWPLVPSWDGAIYARAAAQLARGEGYTQRILGLDRATPTAFYPVGYPAMLSAVRRLGGDLRSDLVLQSAIGTSLVPVAYVLARRTAGRRAGQMSAWVAALWPGAILLSATWLAEPLFALGAGLALLPVAYARRRQRARALALSALLLGAVAYVRPSALPIAVFVGASAALAWSREPRRPRAWVAAVRCGALCGALACLPLAPWALRNTAQLGSPVLVSTNGGLNLLIGALADGSFRRPEPNPCPDGLHELARERCYTEHALREIRRAPLAWLGRGLHKLWHTFGHESAPAQCFVHALQLPPEDKTRLSSSVLGVCRLGWLVLLVGAVTGALHVARERPPIMRALLFAPVLALAALHFVYVGGDRYHAAVMPLIAALAGVGYAWLSPRPVRRDS